MRDPNGRVHCVAPVYGFRAVPAPLPPTQLGGATAVSWTNTSLSWLRTLPEFCTPLAAKTLSVKLLIVRVSCASSTLLRIVYVHEYGLSTCVGLTQPLVAEIPCWTGSCALAKVTLKTAIATSAAPAPIHRSRCFLIPFLPRRVA